MCPELFSSCIFPSRELLLLFNKPIFLNNKKQKKKKSGGEKRVMQKKTSQLGLSLSSFSDKEAHSAKYI